MSIAVGWGGGGWYSRPWTGLSTENGHVGKPVLVVCDHAADQPVCPDCRWLLAQVLDDVPALLWDLELAEVKDVRFIEHGSFQHDRTEAEVVLPWNERATKARLRLAFELRAAADACLRHDERRPANLARRLRRHLPILVRRDDAPEWAARISHAASWAHAAIDRPPSPWYYGPCPKCRRDLYQERVEDPEARVECAQPDCDYAAELADHRLTQLDAGEDRLLTVGELVGAITSAGEAVNRDQINNWIRREGLPRERRVRPRMLAGGHLANHEVYVYRLGDVRRLALDAERRRIDLRGRS